MNKRQRDANRATAFMARWALQRPRQSFGGTAGSGSMVILSSSDFTRGSTARPTFVCYDDPECSAPTAVEEAAKFATSLDSVWVSTSVLAPMRYMDARLNRYGFLTSYAARNDAEQSEMETLRAALAADGIDPGWEEVPRRETTDEDLAVFQIRKERSWLP